MCRNFYYISTCFYNLSKSSTYIFITLMSLSPDKPYNELPKLPPKADLETSRVLKAAISANRKLAELKGKAGVIPNQSILINSLILQEAKASSEIENVITTNDKLFEAFSAGDKNHDPQTKEVLRYREALWTGFNQLKNRPLTTKLFLDIVQTIKQNNAGIRSTTGTVIANPASGKVIYTPPEGEQLIRDLLNNLEQFIHENDDLDPLIKMAIIHYQFEAIHPFRDANGRAGRIINIHYIAKAGLIDLPILFLSRYIIEHKQEYYDTLAGVSQRGDWQSWLLYMLRAVESTARLTFDKVNDILNAKQAVLEAIQEETTFQRPDQLVDAICTQPFTKVRHLTDAGLYAENTARSYLNELAEMGVLEKKQIKGRHYYQNRELEQILSY